MADVVVMKEVATGNDHVGEMWTEVAVFPSDATLNEVLAWLRPPNCEDGLPLYRRVTLQVAEYPQESNKEGGPYRG